MNNVSRLLNDKIMWIQAFVVLPFLILKEISSEDTIEWHEIEIDNL